MKVHSRSGFSMIELVLSTAVLIVLLGAAAVVQKTSTGLATASATAGLIDEASHVALERLAADLRFAENGSLLVTEDNGASRVDLRTPVNFAGGAPVWSTVVTYRLEPSPIDSNGDGLQNEMRLVRIQDGGRQVLCSHVLAGGFTIVRAADVLTARLRLARVETATDGLMSNDASTTITIRN